jgi:hypothetical protein
MKRQKKFDCVEMKWKIQQKLRKQYAGMTEEEARRAQREKVMRDPILGPFLRAVSQTSTQGPSQRG